MIRDDEHWLRLTDGFHAAALDPAGWHEALTAFAEATGSQHGQLVCMGDDASRTFNLLTNVDPRLPDAFLAAGGADPAMNPRRRAGIAQPPLTIIAEADFITPDAVKRDAHYQEFAVPWDVPYICLTTLERRPGILVGLSVIRTRRQGHIDAEGRRAFASIAPHVRAAVRTNLALADQTDVLVNDTFGLLEMPAFVCDRTGVVRRLTPAAEALVSSARALALKQGKLTARVASEAAALTEAIEAVAGEVRVGAPTNRVARVHGSDRGEPPLFLDVIRLPSRALPFAFDARVLVLVRGVSKQSERQRRVVLRSVFGMTVAESEIALLLGQGRTPEAIARQRGVSIGTVRVQIKSVLAKAGVSRQVELVARINQL